MSFSLCVTASAPGKNISVIHSEPFSLAWTQWLPCSFIFRFTSISVWFWSLLSTLPSLPLSCWFWNPPKEMRSSTCLVGKDTSPCLSFPTIQKPKDQDNFLHFVHILLLFKFVDKMKWALDQTPKEFFVLESTSLQLVFFFIPYSFSIEYQSCESVHRTIEDTNLSFQLNFAKKASSWLSLCLLFDWPSNVSWTKSSWFQFYFMLIMFKTCLSSLLVPLAVW